jgi:hypothetical protein
MLCFVRESGWCKVSWAGSHELRALEPPAERKKSPRQRGLEMKITKCIFLVAATAVLSANASAQSQKVVTLDMAKTMAEEAMAQCRSDGYKVTVLVVDSLNTPKALLRDDGATSATTEVAKMKATATMFLWHAVRSSPATSAGHPGAAPARPRHLQRSRRGADQSG